MSWLRLPLIIFALCFITTNVFATNDELEPRHGTIKSSHALSIEGGFTSIAQVTSDNRIQDEWLTSFDLLTVLKKGNSEWFLFVEGNTSPRIDGVSLTISEANNDAGSATDKDNKGRFQVSELHYSFPFQQGRVNIGLINPAGNIDGSEIANDETSQFISTVLVNNPTIDLPDYAIGAAFNYEFQSKLAVTLLLSSSHGLADNPDKSYSQLVDVNATGKGSFIAAEFHSHHWGMDIRAGLWRNSSDHAYLDGRTGNTSNNGFYTSIDGKVRKGKWNIRFGLADKEVSQAAQFLSAAVEYPILTTTLGIGVAKTTLSDSGRNTGEGDTSVAEIYAHHALSNTFHFTPVVQWVSNSGFDQSNSRYDANLTIYSLRIGYTF